MAVDWGEGFCLDPAAWCPISAVKYRAGHDPSGRNIPRLISIVPTTVAFVRKITAQNREKMKWSAIAGTDGRWSCQRNGSVHIVDTTDVGRARVIRVENVQRRNALGWGKHQASSHEMEMTSMERMVSR
jgi:hypothetical protein